MVLRQGDSLSELRKLIRETAAGSVFWNRRYEPVIARRDHRIQEELQSAGLIAEDCVGTLLHEPWTVATKTGGPYQVFTPFWRACLATDDPPPPLRPPPFLPSPRRWPAGLDLSALRLEPSIHWTGGLRAAWRPGTAGAQANLDRLLQKGFADYADGRNTPSIVGTSRLSPHLRRP